MTNSRDDMVSGEGRWLGLFARGALRAMSVGYGLGVAARNARYNRCGCRAVRAAVPVISVGNITTGGTGKTPLVIDIIERLRAMGRCPAVVSRGYKSGASGLSDELMLIERRCPGIACVAAPDRVAGAEAAVSRHGADVVVLDDGFQHRRIARDLDIVVIDATRPFGGGYLLPRGRLREPAANIRRADLVVITRTDQVEPAELTRLEKRLNSLAGNQPQLTTIHRPLAVRSLESPTTDNSPRDESPPASNLPDGAPVFLMSGIGNPESFERTVESLDLDVLGRARFPDHHHYDTHDVLDVCHRARRAGALHILTTEKDAVKLARLNVDWQIPAFVLGVRIDFCRDGGKIMDGFLRRTLSSADRSER